MTEQSKRLNAMMQDYPEKIQLGFHDGEAIYLSRPSFDCNWYWGFGYIGNRNCHYHLNGISEGKNINLHDALLIHFEGSFILKGNAVWKFAEIVRSIYTLKDTAQLFTLGGSHLTTNPGKDLLSRPDLAREINEVMIPQQIAEMYKVLLEEKT